MHLAWCTKPGQYWTSPDNERWLTSSLILVRSFFELGGVRFVGAGSCAEYEWNNVVCREGATPLLPQSVYGSSKCKLFEALEQLNRQGASCAWGRVFWTYGPGEDRGRLVPFVINNLLKKEIARCSSGSQIRDYMHVADVAAAFKTLIHSDVKGAVNIGSGHAISVRDLVNFIANELDARDLVQFAAQTATVDGADIVSADVGKLNALGFKPRIDLSSGIDGTIKWWQTIGAGS